MTDDHSMQYPQEDDARAADVLSGSTPPLADQYLAGWKRAQADYQNLLKEVDRERVAFATYAHERLLEKLLPAMDQFELAMRHTPDLSTLDESTRKPIENWMVGLRAVETFWGHVVADVGLERVPVDGTFDPSIHEACGEREADNVSPGMILEVVQNGWRLHGKVLRPARVILVKGASSPPPSDRLL